MRILFTTLVACTLAAPPALAQQTAPGTATTPPAATTAPAPAAGQWRASKLMGVDVYNTQNEKLGEINELIIDSSGRVAGAVIGVGGFLGMGEHDVMVSMDKLQFSDDAGKTTTGAGSGESRQWYPDRALLNANKDQLKAMPQFKY